MLLYEEFKNKVINDFVNYMGPKYKLYTLQVKTVKKVNRILDGLSLLHPSKVQQIVPTIYIEDMYECYKDSENYDEVIYEFCNVIKRGMKGSEEMLPKIDYKKVKEKVIFQLINTRNNTALLSEIPHREFMDLSIIYRWAVNIDSNGVSSVVIHNEFMEALDLDEEALFNLALENTKRLLPVEIRSMKDVLQATYECDELYENTNDLSDKYDECPHFFIVTNKSGFIGASSMLYDDILEELAERTKTDLYIIPSSINELIVIGVRDDIRPEVLLEMVIDFNKNEVDPSYRLSNSVYYYSASKRSLSPIAFECTR